MEYLNELLAQQQTFQGFVAKYQLLIGMILMPVIYFIPRMAIWVFNRLKSILTISVVFDESDNVTGYKYAYFINWLRDHQVSWLNRSFEVLRNKEVFILGSGLGSSLFKFKGKYFFAGTVRNEKSNTTQTIGKTEIICFKWNRYLIDELMRVSLVEPITDKTRVYEINNGYALDLPLLSNLYGRQKQYVSNVTYNTLQVKIEEFLLGEQHYDSHDKPYKETILLYGPPGSAKTTLCRHFAVKYGFTLFTCSPENLMPRMALALESHANGNPAMLLIEDIDSNPAFINDAPTETNANIVIKTGGELDSYDKTTLSTMLNILDGVNPLSNVIVIMTTNYPEKLKPAIYRAGRVDKIIKVDFPTIDEVIDILGWEEDDNRLTTLKEHIGSNRIPASIINRLVHSTTKEEVLVALNDKELAFNLINEKVTIG